MKVPDRIYTVQTYALDGCVMFAYYFGEDVYYRVHPDEFRWAVELVLITHLLIY